MNKFVIDLFVSMLQKPEQERYVTASVLEYPALLSPACWQQIYSYIKENVPEQKTGAENLLLFLETGYDKFKSDNSYPYGYGPVEHIYEQYQNGSINAATAETLARQPATAQLLSPIYISRLCRAAEEMVAKKRSLWNDAIVFINIIIAAVNAIPEGAKMPEEWEFMRNEAAVFYLEIIAFALIEVPDKRLLDKGIKYGEDIAAANLSENDEAATGEVYHRLGVLHLDPYFFEKNSSNYQVQFNNWQEQLYDYYGQDLAGVDNLELLMPAPLKAVETAITYFDKALPYRKMTNRGLSLKALCEALMWQNFLAGTQDYNRLCETGTEAINLLSKEKGNESKIAWLTNVLDVCGCSPAALNLTDENATEILELTPEELINKYGTSLLFSNIASQLNICFSTDKKKALDLYIKAQDILNAYPDEAAANNHFSMGRTLCFKFADDFVKENLNQNTSVLFDNYISHFKQNSSQDFNFYFSIITIITQSISRNEEAAGLQLLQQLGAALADDKLFTFLVPLINYLTATLQVGEAVNQYDQNNLNESINYYFEALSSCNQLGYINQQNHILDDIADLCAKCEAEGCEIIVAQLSIIFLQLEKTGSASVSFKCRNICITLLQRFCKNQPVKPIILLILFQLLKGYSFASLLTSPVDFSVKEENEKLLLSEIEKLFSRQDVKFPGVGNKVIDKETLLTAFAGTLSKQDGEDEATRLKNLRISFDNLFYKNMLGQINTDDCLLMPDHLQALLSDQSVVMIHYLGPSVEGFAASYTLFVTKENYHFTYGYTKDLPSGFVELREDNVKAKIPILAFIISSVRKDIVNDDPDDSGMSQNAASNLDIFNGILLGGEIPLFLEEFKKLGKNKLYIWPHSSFHYFPFHLLSLPSGKFLCEEWMVATIPNLAVLHPKQTLSPVQHEISVMAMTFTNNNAYGLPELPNAVSLTKPVADLFSTEVISDEGNTEARFLDNLRSSRWVHLYTHGYLNAEAPAFHALFLEPDKNADGILYAYEIAGIDLANVDLLTLCACETALGRFDDSDNLRGLPASFLLAGVTTIIGTLWEAEEESGACFFESLYQDLKLGKTKQEAFKNAQALTRKSYPECRDWGAFYYLGK